MNNWELWELLGEMVDERMNTPFSLAQIARELALRGEEGYAKLLCRYSAGIREAVLGFMEPGPIPEHSKAGIDAFIKDGIPPGDFLYAVLTKDLSEAFGRADNDNRKFLFDIVAYCYNELPARCWGSKKNVGAWLAMHAERRKKEREEAAS